MSIPPVTHPIWQQMLTGKINWPLESLPIKIFLGTARLQLASNATQLGRLTRELHDLFVKNERLPSVQRDLARIQ